METYSKHISQNMENYSEPLSNSSKLIPGLPFEVALECLLRVPITSIPTLRQVSHTWKSTLSHPSFFSERRRLSLSDHLIFLIQPVSPPPPQPTIKPNHQLGGPPLYNLNIYNLIQHDWHHVSLPVPTFAQCVSIPAANKLVVLGGWDPSTLQPVNRVLVIDLVTGTWKDGKPMPTARSFFAAVSVGTTGIVYVAGGHDGHKNALKSAEAYDVEADKWWALPSMLEERDESHGLSFDGKKFWVVSGYETDSQGRFRSDCEVFDPVLGSWEKVEGVWPYSGTTPKSTVVVGINQHRRWLCFVDGQMMEFEWEEKRWKGLELNSNSNSIHINGSSSISLVDIGGGDNDGVMMIGNGGNRDEDCEEGCGGKGVFVLEREENDEKVKKGGGVKWKHVHAPISFLGIPFSTSHLIV